MRQPALLEMLNDTIKRALNDMLVRGLVTDESLAKRIQQGNNLPLRKLQALMLTSNAFCGMSVADAANVMGVETGTVEYMLWDLRKKYPQLVNFERIWKSDRQAVDNPLSLDDLMTDASFSEEAIIHQF